MTKQYTRRNFIVAAGAAGVGTVLAGSTGALAAPGTVAGRGTAVGSSSNRRAVASLTRSELAPLVGSKFRLANGTATQAVVLESVDDLAGGRSEGRFSLMFRGARSAAWPQGTYAVSHRSVGRASLLVVPVDRGAKARRYQVIVNRG